MCKIREINIEGTKMSITPEKASELCNAVKSELSNKYLPFNRQKMQ